MRAKLWLLGMASAALAIWGVWPSIRDRPAPPPPKIEGSIPFDRELWLKHAQPSEQHLRMNMSQDLLDRILTIGKLYAEVVHLLGPPPGGPARTRRANGQPYTLVSYDLTPSDVPSSESVPKHFLHIEFDSKDRLVATSIHRNTGFGADIGLRFD